MNARAQRVINTEHYFGACPECGSQDGYVNVRANHWAVCDAHRTTWCIGSNLFSGWREEPPELWKKNAAKLGDYKIVEPLRMVDRVESWSEIRRLAMQPENIHPVPQYVLDEMAAKAHDIMHDAQTFLAAVKAVNHCPINFTGVDRERLLQVAEARAEAVVATIELLRKRLHEPT